MDRKGQAVGKTKGSGTSTYKEKASACVKDDENNFIIKMSMKFPWEASH